ncbi:hypothetical protein, partial [Desulfurivibrio dismutans]|uniref:hypothetical protein n=1 Tax=Desulfurivibrio dismutans TaxID=1398908 RepID=UPI0023DC62E4
LFKELTDLLERLLLQQSYFFGQVSAGMSVVFDAESADEILEALALHFLYFALANIPILANIFRWFIV